MAVVGSNLTAGGHATTYVTASITPASNALILATIVVETGTSTNPGNPSLSGNGLTWVLVDTVGGGSVLYDSTSGSRRKVFVFRAMGASPSAGAVTITPNETSTGILWVIDQITGIDTSGTNGSGAIVQSATGADETGTVNHKTVTLGAFGNVNNGTYGASGYATGNLTFTAGTGFTKLNNFGLTSPGIDVAAEFAADNRTSVFETASANDFVGQIGLEIKAAPTIALTGTVTASITEADIVAGGKTIILTIVNDTWIAAGAGSFDLQRANIIAGLTSAQSETLGWNNVVKVLQSVGGVVRTSDTVVTITLDAFATYDITANETITATIPSTALTEAVVVVANPTFTVTAVGGVAKVASGFMTTNPHYWG